MTFPMREGKIEFLEWFDVRTDEYIASELTGFVRPYFMDAQFLRVSSKSMVCVLTLTNLFMVHGDSAVIDPLRFDARIGCKYALADAVRKASGHIAYLQQERKANGLDFSSCEPAPFPRNEQPHREDMGT